MAGGILNSSICEVLWQVWSSTFPSIIGFWRCSLWRARWGSAVIYHATHLQHAKIQDPGWHRIQEAAGDPDRLDQGAELPGAGRLRQDLRGSGEGPQCALHPEPGVGQWGWSWLRRDQRVRGPLWAAGSWVGQAWEDLRTGVLVSLQKIPEGEAGLFIIGKVLTNNLCAINQWNKVIDGVCIF